MSIKSINKFLLIIFCICLLFTFTTIAYSAISMTFYIDGTAKAKIEKEVRITDFKVFNVSDGVLSSYEEFRVDGIKSGVVLPNSNSFVTYKIEVTNYGFCDVIIDSISGINSELIYEISEYNLGDKICDNTGKCNLGAKKEFFITIKYANYTGSSSYDLDLVFDFKSIYSIEYRYIDNNGYPTTILEGENLNITFTGDVPRKVKYIVNGSNINDYNYFNGVFSASNVNGNVVIENGNLVRAVNGDGTKVGDIVEIGDEAFYVMKNDGVRLTLLAKYNLYVGGVYANNKLTDYGSSATGIQNSSMIAWKVSGQPWTGVTPYSSSSYWSTSGRLNSNYGTNYPAYVYDSNATIYPYVDNYKNYLVRMGAEVLEARVPTYEEAIEIGCNPSSKSCSNAPNWFYATTFWLGSAYNDSIMYRISSDCYINWDTSYYDYARGVRPVIVVPTSSISANVTYHDIIDNSYPSYVIYDTDLSVKFTGDVPAGIDIFINGEVYDNYTYSNGNLIVYDVYNDIEIYSSNKNQFGYTGTEEKFVAKYSGIYRLEAWGAQGGSYNSTYHGGYGAYATGEISLNAGETLFVYVGGAGSAAPIPITSTFNTSGGYNGGGSGTATADCNNFASSGGGATHISSNSGVLSSLENSKDSIYIVAAGGGGSSSRYCSGSDWHYASGGNGGGIEGDSDLVFSSSGWPHTNSTPATQTSGGIPGLHNGEPGATAGTFGQGGSWSSAIRNSNYVSAIGGGGGFYGGAGGMFSGGGGGSSYIGNTKLTNKVMYCYNCKESSETSTKTITTTSVSNNSVRYSAKSGNGYAKITYLGKNY